MLIRGFKSWCENTAVQLRKELGIAPIAPFSPMALADYLEVKIITPDEVLGLTNEDSQTLLSDDKNSWSAVTISTPRGDLIIHNPTHSLARRTSDLMHELSHLIIGHEPASVLISQETKLAIRSFDADQEGEAAWLSGCLLVPREAALYITRICMPVALACRTYCVSNQLLRYRLNVTGVKRQVQSVSNLARENRITARIRKG